MLAIWGWTTGQLVIGKINLDCTRFVSSQTFGVLKYIIVMVLYFVPGASNVGSDIIRLFNSLLYNHE
jgi:hypothetical protein